MNGAGRLAFRFDEARRRKHAAFVAYVTAGDPDLAATGRIVLALGRAGVDVVELGVPFSDPIADGPVIQRASERALASGTTLGKVLDLARRLSGEPGAPSLVLFSYLNPIHRMGYARFAERAADSGIDGVLLTDLPIDEPEPLYGELSSRGIATIPLLSPTSGPARVAAAKKRGAGFCYYISRTGVTGARSTLEAGLADQVYRIRKKVPLPVAVGFGISTPAQVHEVAAIADGVVVGSAIVSEIERATRAREGIAAAVERFVLPLVAATARAK